LHFLCIPKNRNSRDAATYEIEPLFPIQKPVNFSIKEARTSLLKGGFHCLVGESQLGLSPALEKRSLGA
jgi:hypothetical protein